MASLHVMCVVVSLATIFILSDGQDLRSVQYSDWIRKLLPIKSQTSDLEIEHSGTGDIMRFTIIQLIKHRFPELEHSLDWWDLGALTKRQRGSTKNDLQEMASHILQNSHSSDFKDPARRIKRSGSVVSDYDRIKPYIIGDSVQNDNTSDTYDTTIASNQRSTSINNTEVRDVFADIRAPQNETREETFDSLQVANSGGLKIHTTDRQPTEGVTKKTWMYQGMLSAFDAVAKDTRRKRSMGSKETGHMLRIIRDKSTENQEETASIQRPDHSTTSPHNFTIQQIGGNQEGDESNVKQGECRERDKRYCFGTEKVCTDLLGQLAKNYACADKKICCDMSSAP